MLWTVLKWGLPLLSAIAAAGALTRKTFHVEIFIETTPEQVWAVLTDTAAYPEWNSVFVAVEGAYTPGAKLLNKVRDPSGRILEMTATVVTLAEARGLRQKGGLPGILSFDHQWLLEPVDGGTRVTQHEVDRGIGLWFWNSDWIEPSYAKVNEALARRALQADQ